MRAWLLRLVGVGFLAGAVSPVAGQIPADIRAKMDGYVGTWSYDEMTRGSPSAAERRVTGTWEARWLFDSLIQWNWTGSSPDGPIDGVELEGYDPIMQGYTFSFGSDGSRGEAFDGEWDGTTFRLQFIEHSATGEISRGRCTWPYSADFTALQNYSCEKLTDGRWWVFRRGSARKTSR